MQSKTYSWFSENFKIYKMFLTETRLFSGPQCVLSCAKERRKLPDQGYTCCLALDGVNIVTSGFEKDVKVKCPLCTPYCNQTK